MSAMQKKHTLLLTIGAIASVVSSLSLIVAAMVNSEGKHQSLLLIGGIVFWIGLILEQVFLWSANGIFKKLQRSAKKPISGRAGVISLAATPEGAVADVVCAGSLIALMVCLIFGIGAGLLQFIFISLLVLSFRMHCILNGKNYRYIKITHRKAERRNG